MRTVQPKQHAYVINSVYDLELTDGERFILKVQFWKAAQDWNLQTSHYIIQRLQQIQGVPVASFCRYDNEGDILPHPYLLSNKLPGQHGDEFFQQTGHTDRVYVSAEMGHVLGLIHDLPIDAAAPLGPDLNQWRQVVADALEGDPVFKAELDALKPDFFPRFHLLLKTIDAPAIEQQAVPLWLEGALHNVLVQPGNGQPVISGLYDFQACGRGSRLFNFAFTLDNIIKVNLRCGQEANPQSLFDADAYSDAFYQAYQATGNPLPRYTDWQRTLVEIVRLSHGGIRHWWDCLGVVHRKTAEWLENIIEGLER